MSKNDFLNAPTLLKLLPDTYHDVNNLSKPGYRQNKKHINVKSIHASLSSEF